MAVAEAAVEEQSNACSCRENRMSEIIRRYFDGVESRAEESDDGKIISGRGIVYNVMSPVYWGMQEIIMPGAATECLKTDDIRGLFNHQPDNVLSRYRPEVDGTMTLSESKDGLDYRMEINESDPMATGVHARVLRDDVSGSSFAFNMDEDDYEFTKEELEDGIYLYTQTIHKFKIIYDVGPVTYPFYPTTTSDARTDAQEKELRSLCKRHGIDLPGANTKAEKINAAIREQKQREREQIDIYQRGLGL